MNLILASTSRYRKSLLEKLRIPFTTANPDIDESPLADESAEALVQRLAKEKALAIANHHNNSWIIGSDQVACIDGQILGKPHTHENAVKQLQQASGKQVEFVTGLCLVNTTTGDTQVCVDVFPVQFRQLNNKQIETYLKLEQPYDCAGSFKSEGLGICLFEALLGDDPNTLVGLPLIKLMDLFAAQDIDVFDYMQ